MKRPPQTAKAHPATVKVWRTLKDKYPDCILVIRSSENYLGFNKDAKQLAAILGGIPKKHL